MKPPHLLIKMGLVEEGTLWLPTRALYGFRKSPRLWRNYRDSVLREKVVKYEKEKYRLQQCLSEPNLWRIQGRNGETTKALTMVYVDDIFAVGEEGLLREVVRSIQEWKTSPPEWVGEEPIRFLGMEIRKKVDTEEGEEIWAATQCNYVKDLLRRNLGDQEEKWLKRKIPMTRDAPGDIAEKVTGEQVKEAQRVAGELLWLVTRTRPDVMFAVAKMASMVLHHPVWVKEAANQLWGYLVMTQGEGIVYRKKKNLEPWDEESGLRTYADASFSPGGEESHGCVVVSLRGGPLVWRSSKQGSVTLSTAEAELNELIEGLMLGESVAAVVEELEPNVMKLMISDSQAAVNIVMAEGGSWRTRHLRLRAAHAKQRFTKGDWILRHRPGEEMIADIGTKALTATRLHLLKGMLGMEEVVKVVEEGKEKVDREEKEVKVMKTNPEVEAVLRMIVTLATMTMVKAQGREAEDQLSLQGWLLLILAVVMMVVGMVVMAVGCGRGLIWMTSAQRRREPEEEPSQRDLGGEREPRTPEGVRRRQLQNDVVVTPTRRDRTPQTRPDRSARMASECPPPPEGYRWLEFNSEEPEVGPRMILVPETPTPTPRREGRQMHTPGSERRRQDTPMSRQTSSGWSESGAAGSGRYQMESMGSYEVAHPPETLPDEIPAGKGQPHPSHFRGKGSTPDQPKGKGKGKEAQEEPDEAPGSVAFGGIPMVPPMPAQGEEHPPPGVYITRWGTKFHLSRRCGPLSKSRLEISQWCLLCRGDEINPGVVFSQGTGAMAHVSARCPRAPLRYNLYERCGLCG